MFINGQVSQFSIFINQCDMEYLNSNEHLLFLFRNVFLHKKRTKEICEGLHIIYEPLATCFRCEPNVNYKTGMRKKGFIIFDLDGIIGFLMFCGAEVTSI